MLLNPLSLGEGQPATRQRGEAPFYPHISNIGNMFDNI